MNISQLHWKQKLGMFLMVLGFTTGLAIFGGKVNGSWGIGAFVLIFNGLNYLIRDPSEDDSEGNFPFWSKK